MRNTVLVDTGFLVALFDRTDRLHESAKQMLATRVRDRHLALVSVWPTVVETCFFLDPPGKRALLQWIERSAMRLRPIEIRDLTAIGDVIARFAEHNIDLADATLFGSTIWRASAASGACWCRGKSLARVRCSQGLALTGVCRGPALVEAAKSWANPPSQGASRSRPNQSGFAPHPVTRTAGLGQEGSARARSRSSRWRSPGTTAGSSLKNPVRVQWGM